MRRSGQMVVPDWSLSHRSTCSTHCGVTCHPYSPCAARLRISASETDPWEDKNTTPTVTDSPHRRVGIGNGFEDSTRGSQNPLRRLIGLGLSGREIPSTGTLFGGQDVIEKSTKVAPQDNRQRDAEDDPFPPIPVG